MSMEHDRILLFPGLRIFIGRSRHLSEELTNAPSASYRREPNASFEAPLPPLGWINLPSLTPLPPSRLPVPGAGTIAPIAPPAAAPVAVASSAVAAPVAPLIEAAPGVNPTDSARRGLAYIWSCR